LRALKPEVYVVSVGSLTITCHEGDLVPKRGKRARAASTPPVNKKSKSKATPSAMRKLSIDLHGLTVAEALEKVERGLDRALQEEADRLDIVHGLGTGKLKDAVHRYLKGLSVVKHFKAADGNPGITWVFM
jgi:DNA mismatch repair protein MutS2